MLTLSSFPANTTHIARASAYHNIMPVSASIEPCF